jgi:RNase P protein component
LVREAFRTLQHDLPGGTDWVVIPRPGTDPDVTQLRDSLLALACQLRRRLPALSSDGTSPGASSIPSVNKTRES